MQIRGRLIGLAAVATVAAAVPIGITLSADAATDTLLSKGRPATALSLEAAEFAAGNAVDGNTGTRWASAEGSDPQWIRVDLGAVRSISRVKLVWETAYGKAYEIQTSTDDRNWNTIASTKNGDGGTDEYTGLSAKAQFVRMYGTARGTEWGYSLYELEVYGTDASQPAPTATTKPPTTKPPATTPATSTPRSDLSDPAKKDIAMQIVSSAENSTLNWRAQYGYIEDIGDGRGYTAGIIGFCSGTGDMLEVVQRYTTKSPNNVLAKYLPALRAVDGSDSHAGLDPNFPADWATAAKDPVFQAAQDSLRDEWYFNPAVDQAKRDGLRALGQFIYYDAIVMHGPGDSNVSFGGIRAAALRKAKTPAQGGDEVTYLNAFLDARVAAMKTEEAHSDTSRVDTAQRVFLRNGNMDLNPPLSWNVYGDPYTIP